ncbi:MAG: zinc metalloprotease HtpX [Candidatus Micrarchaeota archaeon]|nr:zinc metalloprotease HtpX [Candidatus Micrarchaeota archaeon]
MEQARFNPGWGMKIRILLTTVLVFGVITALIGAILHYTGIAGTGSILFWLIVSFAMTAVQWWLGPSIIKLATGAKELRQQDAPELFEMVQRLSKKAGLPMPKLYLVKDPSPNAFAFGRTQSDSGIAVHTGLLSVLDKQEIEGVMAHELGHINNRDVAVMTVASVLPVLLYYGVLIFSPRGRDEGPGIGTIVGAFVAQFIGQLMVMWLSRQREYAADEFSARLTSNPNALMTALAKISYGRYFGKFDQGSMVKALYFSEPSSAKLDAHEIARAISSGNEAALAEAIEKEKRAGAIELLMTHPLTAKRLENLMRIKKQAS